MKLKFCLISFGCIVAAGSAFAAEAVYTNLMSSANWNAPSNWQDGYVPTADDVAVLTNSPNGSVSRTIAFTEDAAVKGLRLYQGKSGSDLYLSGQGGNLAIGEKGIAGIPYGSQGDGLPYFQAPIDLTATQLWEIRYNGMGNMHWRTSVDCDISGGKDVIWSLGGAKWMFNSGSSTNFLGTSHVQTRVAMVDPGQFNRLGKEAILCATNCFGATFVESPVVNFAHTTAATGTVNTAFRFDSANAGKNVSISIPVAYPHKPNTTVFRGAWTGDMCGSSSFGLSIGGDMYHLRTYASGNGTFTMDHNVMRFENDMSGLTVYPCYLDSGSSDFNLGDGIIVLASDKVFGMAGGPQLSTGGTVGIQMKNNSPGRLKALLTTDGLDMSAAPHVGNPTYPVPATTLYGISGAGYSEWNGIRAEGAKSGGRLDTPYWLYADHGGTCRFKSAVTYYGTSKLYLPVQIWGGGTIIMSCSGQWAMNFEGTHPFWVRSGRLVVGGGSKRGGIDTYAAVQVGVECPKTFSVRAMTMNDFYNEVANYDGQTLTLNLDKDFDGVKLEPGDTVLINCPDGSAMQPGAMYNGLYAVGENTRVFTRLEDFNEADEIIPDIRADIREGRLYAGTRWFVNNDSYRANVKSGNPQTMTFSTDSGSSSANSYVPAFVREMDKEPDVAFLVEGTREVVNTITVVDNASTGESALGGYDENATVSFTGAITNLKDRLTLTAPAGTVVSFTGTFCGTNAVKKTGAGTIVLNPSDATLAITNLVIESGKLSVAAKCLHKDLKTVEFAFTNGTSSLELTGDVDLSGWTLKVTGLTKPADRKNPPAFDISVTSKDGTVSGTPTVVLEGSNTRRWTATREGNVWKVRRPCRGTIMYVGSPVIRLVLRTDFAASSVWTNRTIEGKGFLPQFYQVYWTADGRTDAPLDMYRECVDVMHGGVSSIQRNDIVSGGSGETAMINGGYARCARDDEKYAEAYTFPQVFGSSLTGLRAGAHADMPFFFCLSGDRPPFYLNASYPLADNASYETWRDAQTHFVSTYTLGEFDTEAMWYRAYSGVCTDTVARASLRAAFPFPPSGTSEAILQRDYFKQWVIESVAREKAFYFGETNFWSLCSSCPSLQPIMAEAGACGFSYEATTQGAGSWTVPGAITRGAARQFGVPFSWYTANFYSGYTRAGTAASGENSTALTPMPGYSFMHDGGASRSTINRQNTYGWLIGAATVEPENWYHYHRQEVTSGTFVASDFANDLQALCDRAKTTDRGVSYTPLAILVPLWERLSRTYGDYARCDPWSANALFLTLEPPNAEQNGTLYDLQRRNGDEACFFNSPFGGIYDVICPDATRNRENVQTVLGAYKAAIVAGDFRSDEIPEDVFEAYAAAGGTLFVSADKVKSGIVASAAAGVAFGSSTAAAGSKLYDATDGSFASDLSAAYTVMVPDGTPSATPFYRDELGNVLVWSQNCGQGRIVTVACDRMLPDWYANCPKTNLAHQERLLAAAQPGFRFDLIHTLLKRIQTETMPVSVEGDVMWGVNQVKGEGEGEQWMVWLFNNKGVTKFVGEAQVLDESKTATVTVRRNGIPKQVSVPPGGIAYVNF